MSRPSERQFDDETDEKLIAEAKDLHSAIYELDCFGSHDVRMLEAITEELANRGYRSVQSIDFVKEG